MKDLGRLKTAPLRFGVIALFAGSLALPAAASAAGSDAGTLVGTVTCGGQGVAAPVTVSLEGANVSARSDSNGKFVLTDVPAAHILTVDAVDATHSLVASRYDVTVDAGRTLDVGALDLPVCPVPDVEALDLSLQTPADVSVDVSDL